MADHAAIRARLDAAKKSVPYEVADRHQTASEAWSELYQHAPADLRALLDENEKLRQALDYYEKRYPCDGGCGHDAPEKVCSRHGLRPTELWQLVGREEADELNEMIGELTAKIARVEALLADTPEHPIHAGGGNLVNRVRAVRADDLRAALDGSET